MSRKKVAKVPMVMQMESVECGAASLTMILAYYGKWLPLEEVRTACGVSRDGSTSEHILRAAHNYGLEAHRESMAAEALEGMQPAIIHWNFRHFVVFRGFDSKGRCDQVADGAVPETVYRSLSDIQTHRAVLSQRRTDQHTVVRA